MKARIILFLLLASGCSTNKIGPARHYYRVPNSITAQSCSEIIKSILGARRSNISPEEFEEISTGIWKKWKFEKVKLKLSDSASKLPAKAKQRIRKVKKIASETKFRKPFFDKNNYTHDETALSEVFAKNFKLGKGFIHAQALLTDKHAWAEYLEKLATDVFKQMERNGLKDEVTKGIIDEQTFVDVLTARHKKRGLKTYTIAPGTELLSFEDFRKALGKGPIIDRAFSPGSSLKESHGPYPHLVQLDYVLDEMKRASKVESHKEFFKFFSTNKGLTVWNDIFDLFGETKKTLNDTEVVTQDFLYDGLGIVPRQTIDD